MSHKIMTHPLFLLYTIDMLLEKIVYVFEIYSFSGRTTAVVRLHISCCALVHQVMCMRWSTVMHQLYLGL